MVEKRVNAQDIYATAMMASVQMTCCIVLMCLYPCNVYVILLTDDAGGFLKDMKFLGDLGISFLRSSPH